MLVEIYWTVYPKFNETLYNLKRGNGIRWPFIKHTRYFIISRSYDDQILLLDVYYFLDIALPLGIISVASIVSLLFVWPYFRQLIVSDCIEYHNAM